MANLNGWATKIKKFFYCSNFPYILLAFDSLLLAVIFGIILKKNFSGFDVKRLFNPISTHILLTGLLLLATLISAILLNIQGHHIAKQWSKGLKNSAGENLDTVQTDIPEVYIDNFKGTQAEKERIIEQLQETKQRSKTHLEITIYFYVRYYTCISIASFAGIVAGSCWLWLSDRGLDDANQYMINLFIVSAGIAILFGGLPLAFKPDKNIADNKALYLRYIALEQEIISYLATQENINSQAQDFKDFIHYIDRQLATLNQIPIGFDSTKIPKVQEIYNKDKL